MAKKRVDSREFVFQVGKALQERIQKDKVIDLQSVRELKKKQEPSTVLVIEDDEITRKAIVRILESEHLLVRAAADASELSIAMEQAPDLILMDVGLPWMNGLELGQLLKQDPELKHIPLVFISGVSTEVEMKQAFQIGADDFLKKPIVPEKLVKTLKILLKLQE